MMDLQFRRLIAAAIVFFFFAASPAAAKSSNLDNKHLEISSFEAVPVNTSSPAVHDAPNLDPVQIAYDNIPHEELFKTSWQGQATVEVYMLSEVVNTVGNVTGGALWRIVSEKLLAACPVVLKSKKNKCSGDWFAFPIKYRRDGGGTAESHNQVHVESSHFENKQVRDLLISTIAGAYEAMTLLTRNCFHAKDPSVGFRYCNVARKVGAYTEDSHIRITLKSDIIDDNDGSFHCCESREIVDGKLDPLIAEFKEHYPTTYTKTRDVACHLRCEDSQRETNIDVDKILAELISIGL